MRHYLGKPDLASRSRGLQLIGFGAFYTGMYCIAPPSPRRACCTQNETWRIVVVLPPTRERRPQIMGSKAQRDRVRAK